MPSVLNASTASGGGIIASGDSSGILQLQTGGTTAVTVDASQNVGIGVTPTTKFQVLGASLFQNSGGGGTYGTLVNYYSGGGDINMVIGTSGSGYVYQSVTTAHALAFGTNNAERMRIDASGNLLVGTTDANQTSGVGLKMIYSATAPSFKTVLNTASGDSAYLLYNTNATNNGYRFYVTANGGITNFSGNNVNLSDVRVKTNIELAGGYLDKICAIPVKLFNYKDEPENEQQTLGVIAQDVEAVAPELVNNEGFGDTPEDGVPLKTIYQTDLQYALMKCIQEQQALITTLTERITALEAK